MVFAASARVTVTAGVSATGMSVAETVSPAVALGLVFSTKVEAAGARLLAGLGETFVRKATGGMLPKISALIV